MGAAPDRGNSTLDDLSEDRLLARFDELINSGLVVYTKDYRIVRRTYQGFPFEFRILSSLTTKPSAASAAPPNCRPGSDIDVNGYEVAALGPPGCGPTHLLAANKFPLTRPHFLILTEDGWRRQHEPLDAEDFAAATQVLGSLARTSSPPSSRHRRRYLLFFNCGLDSGCSRVHKHLQILPVDGDDGEEEEIEAFPLWPDEEDTRPPFRFARERFASGLPSVDELVKAYRALLARAERDVGWAAGREGRRREQQEALPHNLVLTERWMVVIPRRAPGWEGADANTLGMLGMVAVHDEEKLKRWIGNDPVEVLKKLGYPAEE
ncbi:hypothetical protein VTJ83DRAFT_2744 [Remersonia thermophila]|uniref:Uncharacterized protein n=1 Tax=Remersonia thermophila TaxID=72144 RepID=A0ABR4DJL0_9PEZI